MLTTVRTIIQVRRVKLLDETAALDAIRMPMAEAAEYVSRLPFGAKGPDRPSTVDEDQGEQVEARRDAPPRDAGRSMP